MNEMKNIIRITVCCILLAVLFVHCTAAADQHTEIQCRISDSLGSKEVLFDIYEQTAEITTVSTIFRNIAAVFSRNSSGKPFSMDDVFGLFPEQNIQEACRKAEHALDSWLEQQKHTVLKGSFSGELFQSAETMELYEFTFSEFSEYINNIIISNSTNDLCIYHLTAMIIHHCRSFIEENDPDPVLQIRKYDDGCYYTVLLQKGENILLTVSIDRTVDKQRHLVVGYKSEGRNYYRDLYVTFNENEMQMKWCLFGGNDSYCNLIKKARPVFEETVSIRRVNEKRISWNAVLESDKLTDSLCAEGEINSEIPGYYTIDTCISLQNQTGLNINITANVEPMGRQVSFTDKAVKHFSNETEREEIETAVCSEVKQLAAEIIPLIPSDFQNLLINLLMK